MNNGPWISLNTEADNFTLFEELHKHCVTWRSAGNLKVLATIQSCLHAYHGDYLLVSVVVH